MKESHSSKSYALGFTIVEIVFVMAIGAIIMLAIFVLVGSINRSTRNSHRKADATVLLTAISNYAANNKALTPTQLASGFQTEINNSAQFLPQLSYFQYGPGSNITVVKVDDSQVINPGAAPGDQALYHIANNETANSLKLYVGGGSCVPTVNVGGTTYLGAIFFASNRGRSLGATPTNSAPDDPNRINVQFALETATSALNRLCYDNR